MKYFLILALVIFTNAYSATCTTTTRTNYTSGQTLTSSALNADLNQLVSKVNSLDGGCITDGTLESSSVSGSISTTKGGTGLTSSSTANNVLVSNGTNWTSTNGRPFTDGYTGNVVTFAFSYGATATTVCSSSPCAYLDQIGTNVTSITRSSTGVYVVNLSRTFDKIKCFGNAGVTFPLVFRPMRAETSATVSMVSDNNISNEVADSYGTVTCLGTF